MSEIKFAKPVSDGGYLRCISIGRNGKIQTHGIWVYGGETVNAGGYISVQPITSRNNTGRCRIEFPKEEALNVARAILAAAGINAAIVENPRLFINMDEGFLRDVRSNVPELDIQVFDSDTEYLDWDDPSNPNETEEEFGRRFDLAVERFEKHKERAADGLEDHDFDVIAADNLPIVILKNSEKEA